MIIEISSLKYQTGSDRCFDKLEKGDLLEKINSIIEWDFCKFPMKRVKDPSGAVDENGKDVMVYQENREYLGQTPELKPGNVFKYGNQLLAFEDKNTLVLVLSETGAKGLRRVWDEKISQEIDLFYNYECPESVKYEKAEPTDIPENWESYSVPYELMKMFKDRFLPGRDYPKKGLCIKVEMVSDMYLFPVHLYITDWKIYYDPIELEADQLDYATKQLLSWFYMNVPRLEVESKDKEGEEVKA